VAAGAAELEDCAGQSRRSRRSLPRRRHQRAPSDPPLGALRSQIPMTFTTSVIGHSPALHTSRATDLVGLRKDSPASAARCWTAKRRPTDLRWVCPPASRAHRSPSARRNHRSRRRKFSVAAVGTNIARSHHQRVAPIPKAASAAWAARDQRVARNCRDGRQS